MKQTPAQWWHETVVSRSVLLATWLGGALVGFGVFRWGHYYWPDFFTLVAK